MNASLVFGGPAPGPSACEVLWTLYHKVKAAEKMLGNLSLDESSLASDGESPPAPPTPYLSASSPAHRRLGVLPRGVQLLPWP